MELVDPTKAPKMNQTEWMEWSQRMILQHELLLQQQRLDQGKGKLVVFSPFLGEFGHKIMHHVRLVNFIRETTGKVVCCKPGEEVLYPSATGFYYDWLDPVPDSEKAGTDRAFREWPIIEQAHPAHQLVQSGGLSFEEEWHCIEPAQRITFKPRLRGLKVDVCLAVRNREFIPGKNWTYAQLVADALKKSGYTYAVIGQRPTSKPLEGMEFLSGDYGDLDASIEAIQNCKLFFGQDTGTAHLASTVGCDMAVLDVPDQILGRHQVATRTFFDRMQVVNTDHQMTRLDRDLWHNPEAIIEQVLKLLPKKAQVEKIGPVKKSTKKKQKA